MRQQQSINRVKTSEASHLGAPASTSSQPNAKHRARARENKNKNTIKNFFKNPAKKQNKSSGAEAASRRLGRRAGRRGAGGGGGYKVRTRSFWPGSRLGGALSGGVHSYQQGQGKKKKKKAPTTRAHPAPARRFQSARLKKKKKKKLFPHLRRVCPFPGKNKSAGLGGGVRAAPGSSPRASPGPGLFCGSGNRSNAARVPAARGRSRGSRCQFLPARGSPSRALAPRGCLARSPPAQAGSCRPIRLPRSPREH